MRAYYLKLPIVSVEIQLRFSRDIYLVKLVTSKQANDKDPMCAFILKGTPK